MIRLIGILTGSALAVAAIVITLGLPQLTTTEDVPAQAPPVAVSDTPMAVVAEPAAAGDAALPAATVAEDVTEAVTEVVTEVVTEAVTEAATEAVTATEAEVTADPVVPTPAASPSQNWYAFWSPFRSELAADGFIAELQRTTGLDYRVVKLKPGVYEVAFAYSDPPDRDTKLDRIAAATGLDMSGG
ncbi:MAG: hypothetical protein OEN20_04430 [Gammaproteobacteria bacterium]|nr:hypothetical protein [Gammaproteobacteria bacterium]